MAIARSESVGDHGGGWDPDWAALESPMIQLFTRHTPRTVHQFWHRCYFEDLWELMGSGARAARYLEMGAGRGTTSMYLASQGCNVTMLDLSSKGFDVARSNFVRERLRLPTFVHADARRTNLPPESFDCVLSIGLLEHFEDPRPVLSESVRLLRPGGLCFAVIIPQKHARVRYLAHGLFCPWVLVHQLMPDGLKAKVRRVRGRSPSTDRIGVVRTAYSRSEYIRVLDGLNVVDISCAPYNPYHAVYSSAWLETHLSVPLFRLHRAIKRVYAHPPLTSTSAALGSCDLLTFRKRR